MVGGRKFGLSSLRKVVRSEQHNLGVNCRFDNNQNEFLNVSLTTSIQSKIY